MATRPGRSLIRALLTTVIAITLIPAGALAYLSLLQPDSATLVGSVGLFARLALIVTLICVVIAVIYISSLARRRLRPLQAFEDAIKRLTRGEYAHRLKVRSDNEFHSLFRAFNQMTSQLEISVRSSQSVADIDRLILSSADLDTVLQKVLLTARMRTMEINLVLRHDLNSKSLSSFRLEKGRLKEEPIGLLEISDDTLKDVEGYHQIALRVCGEDIQACLPIAAEGTITGVLVARATRALEASESKQLTDLADRLSVAFTNIKRSETLYQKAHFDDLTGLINRHAFEDKLREQISRSWRGEQGALLFIDLDGFKKVNDTEGHKAGDRLLVEISERLQTSLREVDTIARLGGDEFAVIVPGCESEKSVSRLCERLIVSMKKPIVVDRMEHTVGASIGVAIFPDDGKSVEELVMKADSAMYRAKETGRGRFEFFDDNLNEANRHRVLVESRLRGALKRNELNLYFQPKLRLKDHTIDSAEALLRWTDDELGVVSPDAFVPIAEETNLVHEFACVQVDHTADLLIAADAAGVRLEHIAINASTKQLMTDGFAMSLLSQLDRRSLPHHFIEIEVTESVFAADTRTAVRELEILQSAGIRIALDDFGTGFSSLNMLRELPLDVVKIDRSFITELETSDQARILVQHLISIATTLGKEVVAEGVETEIQLQHLREANCHYVQGYLVSKAKPAAGFLELVRSWQSGKDTLQLVNP
jgi:diguanylate cyclase